MASKTQTTAQHILDHIGGPENITSMSHCATRLRFQLRDRSDADQVAIDSDPNVLGVVPQGDNGLQVIMGGAVANYYQELVKLPGMDKSGETKAASSKKEYGGVRGKYSWIDYCFEFLSDTFRPVLWALLGASLIITMLVLFDTFGVQDFRAEEQPPTFQFMHAMWRSVFYFLPVMVGASAAKKLGANEWVGAAIPAALLTPEFLKLGEAGDVVQVFGLPMTINAYGGQVFPPLIAAVGLFWVEKLFKKIIPEAIQMVFVPFFSLLIMIPATAFIFGPFGIGIGNGISNLLDAVNNFSPFVLAIIIPVLYPFLVPLGLHWPLNAIMIQNLATLGYDFIQGPMGAWNFACFGVVAGVMVLSIREHNSAMRQVSLGGLLAGLLGGISEPSLYGVLLRFRKTYFRLIPGCIAGGAVMGLFNVKASAFVFTSLLTIPAMNPMGGYAIGIAVAFFTSFFLVLFMDYRTPAEKEEILARIAAEREGADADVEDAEITSGSAVPATATAAAGTAAAGTAAAGTAVLTKEDLRVEAPMAGTLMPLSEVPDAAFAAGAVGKGAAIDPSGNTVYAPADGKVMAAFPTGHAIGLKLDNGLQMLIHIGVDTVNMEGKGFDLKVAKGDIVKAGQELVTFDRDAIVAAGYSPITPVLVTNHKKFGEINVTTDFGHVEPGTEIFEVQPKAEA